MRKCYGVASYIVVNLSSPNTPGLRSLQFGDELHKLLALLKAEQVILSSQHGRKVPLVVKIAPDLTDDEIRLIAQALLDNAVEGVIATNTTVDRSLVQSSVHREQAGGLSGAQLVDKSTHVIRVLHAALRGQIPIIGVGGILSGEDAAAKISAGASLVQLYTGFIYRGPALIGEAVAAIEAGE